MRSVCGPSGGAAVDGTPLLLNVRRLAPERGGKVPAAAVTAHTSGSSMRRALEAGFNLHVTKPVSPEKLVDVVFRLAHRTEL